MIGDFDFTRPIVTPQVLDLAGNAASNVIPPVNTSRIRVDATGPVVTGYSAFATKGRMPDCTVLLDVPVEGGKARREGGGDVNRLDMEASSFHAKVRDGYLAAAAANPERIRLVDAQCDVETLEARVWDAIAWLFASGN